MRDAGIGRVLVASLHQGIADLLPTRLEFYENWFNPIGLRDGTIGLAPLAAVLSFLRRENGMYAAVTERAGDYAAQWTVLGMSGIRTRGIRALPRPLRARLALGVARRLVHDTYSGSRAVVKVRQNQARVDLRSSIFCGVREPVGMPLCRFYAAAFERILTLLETPATVDVVQCRGAGEPGCVLAVTFGNSERPAMPGREVSP
jgi:bacteriochlorophyll 4-vinyl reductase